VFVIIVVIVSLTGLCGMVTDIVFFVGKKQVEFTRSITGPQCQAARSKNAVVSRVLARARL